jgi:rhodanese-related sulfurtransferase
MAVLQGMAIVGGLSLMLLLGRTTGTAAMDQMSPAALASQLDTPSVPLVLDVRSAREYAQGHIPGAVHMPYREVSARIAELAAWQDHPIVVYCEVGVRASIAELALEQAGFEQVLQLEGDMRAWRQAGLPLATLAPETHP